jgi:hypothetical protein
MKHSKPCLMNNEHAGQAIGVIAHEAGHLAAGRVARGPVELSGVLEYQESRRRNRYQRPAASVNPVTTVVLSNLGSKEQSTCEIFS